MLPRGEPFEARVGVVVVVVALRLDQVAGVAQIGEQVLIEAFVTQPSIDGEDGPAPETGPYAGPTLQKELSHDPNRHWP